MWTILSILAVLAVAAYWAMFSPKVENNTTKGIQIQLACFGIWLISLVGFVILCCVVVLPQQLVKNNTNLEQKELT